MGKGLLEVGQMKDREDTPSVLSHTQYQGGLLHVVVSGIAFLGSMTSEPA